MNSTRCLSIGLASVLVLAVSAGAAPVGTAFTYQGRLEDAGAPANGTYDLRLILYTADSGGSQVGSTVTLEDVSVTNGLFTASLDFGSPAFAGEARWLEIGVRPGSSTGAYEVISPRQELTPAPNALYSQTTPWSGVSGMPAAFADGVDDDVLGGLSCGSGEVAKWSGTAWACAPDANSGGTVTSVGTGAGLTGGPITAAGTIAVNFAGSGASDSVSRSDHNHADQTPSYGFLQMYNNVQNYVGDTWTATNRTLTFNKQFATTLLRITYSDNFYVRANNAQTTANCQWDVRIDGESCNDPTALLYSQTHYHFDNTANNNDEAYDREPRSYVAFCRSTPSGVVGVGTHTVTVYAQRGNTNTLYCQLGENSVATLLVEEVLQPK